MNRPFTPKINRIKLIRDLAIFDIIFNDSYLSITLSMDDDGHYQDTSIRFFNL